MYDVGGSTVSEGGERRMGGESGPDIGLRATLVWHG